MGSNYVRKRLKPFTPEWWAKFTRLDPITGCREWTGFVCRYGYARTHWKGKSGVLWHRISYEFAYGPFDPLLKVCHTCDRPACLEPTHLFLGSQKDNLQDMYLKGRARPRGRTPRRTSVVMTELAASVARKNFNKSGEVVGIVHLIGTSAMTAPWCRVIGGPGDSDARDIPESKRPAWRTVVDGTTGEPVSSSLDSGAQVASADSRRSAPSLSRSGR